MRSLLKANTKPLFEVFFCRRYSTNLLIIKLAVLLTKEQFYHLIKSLETFDGIKCSPFQHYMNILKYESPAGTKAGGLIRAIASVQDLAPSGGENG